MSRSMDGWLPKRALCSQCAVNIRASAQWGEMPVYGDVDLFVRREVSILDPYLVQALLVLRRCHALPTLDWDITFLFKTIEKNNNTRTVQSESSKFAKLLFDQGFQIVIPPRIVANVPEPIGTPSDSILHWSDCCLFRQYLDFTACTWCHVS